MFFFINFTTMVLFIFLVLIWIAAGITQLRDARAHVLYNCEYLIGELWHEPKFVGLIAQVIQADHPVHKGQDHKSHEALAKKRPTPESMEKFVRELLTDLEVRGGGRGGRDGPLLNAAPRPHQKARESVITNWWNYLKESNAIVSFFVRKNWEESARSKKRGMTVLAQGITLLFLLTVDLNPLEFVCQGYGPVTDAIEGNDDSLTLLVQDATVYMDAGRWGKVCGLALTYILSTFTEIFFGTCWVLPILLLLYAEDHFGDMVEETDALLIGRMTELSDTDIWHAMNISTLEDAKVRARYFDTSILRPPPFLPAPPNNPLAGGPHAGCAEDDAETAEGDCGGERDVWTVPARRHRVLRGHAGGGGGTAGRRGDWRGTRGGGCEGGCDGGRWGGGVGGGGDAE